MLLDKALLISMKGILHFLSEYIWRFPSFLYVRTMERNADALITLTEEEQ